MKIESDFVDVYDLQHSMDHEFTWVRVQKTVTVKRGFPSREGNARALIFYLGSTYVVDDNGVLSRQLSKSEVPEFFLNIQAPIALAIPLGSKNTKVIENPSIRQITGIAQLDGNPYRIHQEIEAYLKNRGDC